MKILTLAGVVVPLDFSLSAQELQSYRREDVVSRGLGWEQTVHPLR